MSRRIIAVMARIAKRRRTDGAPFDPWLRVHWRLGGRVVRIARRAMSVTAMGYSLLPRD